MNRLIGRAAQIPVDPATPAMSFSPVAMSVPRRAAELEMRVAAPATGSGLPIILLSHGHGMSNHLASLHGYAPMVDFLSAHGFVVIQPTHLDSKTLGLDPNGPEGPLFWRSRVEDMRFIVDHLREIVAAVPGLDERVDLDWIAAVGHSLGGHTVCMLAGMQVTDPNDGKTYELAEPRIKAFVTIAPPGDGAELEAFASEHFPILKDNSFAEMTAPMLVIAGDRDVSPGFFSSRADWRADAYTLSPGPKTLLTVFGGEHILGGISGYDAGETSDEDPERVAFVRRMIWAYLRTALDLDNSAWTDACAVLDDMPEPLGKVSSKQAGSK